MSLANPISPLSPEALPIVRVESSCPRLPRDLSNLIIEVFLQTLAQAKLGRQTLRSLSEELFKSQKEAALFPSKAALASLVFTVVGVSCSLAGVAFECNQQAAHVFGTGLPFLSSLLGLTQPAESSRVLKQVLDGSSSLCHSLGNGANSLGESYSRDRSANQTFLQHLLDSQAQELRYENELCERLLQDGNKFADTETNAKRAVIQR